MKKLIYACTLLIFFVSCGKKKNEKMMEAVMLAPPLVQDKMFPGKPLPPGQSPKDVERKIIKEGEISFETKNIAGTRKSIYNSVKRLGGYIAEENETNDSANIRNEYVLKARIPENNFDVFLGNVSANASRIDSKNIRARDVTTEYIDITTHLAAKKKLEERYVELLKKGNKISELLEIENKISQIETSIDSTQAQLNYLVKQVEFSSLDITFYTKRAFRDNNETFFTKFIAAISGGWDGLVLIFLGCLSFWPLWAIAIILYFILKNWRKGHWKKKDEKL